MTCSLPFPYLLESHGKVPFGATPISHCILHLATARYRHCRIPYLYAELKEKK